MSGSKNAALPIIAAACLTQNEVKLRNVPRVEDVRVMSELLRFAGANVELRDGVMCLKAETLSVGSLSDSPLVARIRASTICLGALLPRCGQVRLLLPGGCAIGTRKLDLHVLGLRSLGATVEMDEHSIKATSSGLRGGRVTFPHPSVGATENTMIAACVARGTSVIENAAKEPEVVDLAKFLNSIGAEIKGAGTSIIRIRGVEELHGTEYSIIPDRIEMGTYMAAAAVTGGNIVLENGDISLLRSVVSKLRRMGVEIVETRDGVQTTSSGELRGVDIVTEPYPGFPTDMQPIFTPLLCVANGQSKVRETIFDNRFRHVHELARMGAEVTIHGDTMLVKGDNTLHGTDVNSSDLRAGASMVIAGLVAQGQTRIGGVPEILRGYENLINKLRCLGATCVLTTDG